MLDRVLIMTGLKRDIDLSRLFNVSKSTITTWRRRNKVPFEELIRLHFDKKIDFSYCVFGVQQYSHLPVDQKAGPIKVDTAFWQAMSAFRREMRRVYGSDEEDQLAEGYKRVTSGTAGD